MKKWFLFLLVLLVGLPLMAQEGEVPQPPENWMDVVINLKGWFATFGGIAVVTAFIAATLNGLLKITKKIYKQLVAWGIAIILVVVADLLNFGYMAELPIWIAVVHGFAAGLASNGVFDIPWLKSLLDKVEGWFVKPV